MKEAIQRFNERHPLSNRLSMAAAVKYANKLNRFKASILRHNQRLEFIRHRHLSIMKLKD